MKIIIITMATILLASCNGSEYEWRAVGPTELTLEGAQAKCDAKAEAQIYYETGGGRRTRADQSAEIGLYEACMADEHWVNMRVQ